MSVIARDTVASDHLVYAWPFPIGPECEIACAEDEQVVMCPAWIVGDRLGPGRHRWRTPDPSRPVSAYFVLVAPVEASFDMMTSFVLPSTGQPIRVRATGSMQVRCSDPGLLIAQFVGLPFDTVNDGILRSVSRSVERMIARLLTRRVVMAGTPMAVTDTAMLPNIIEELVAYNPTAGAVFGVELIRMGHLTIVADDGSTPYLALPQSARPNGSVNGNGESTTERQPATTMRGQPPAIPPIGRQAHLPTEPPPLRAIQTSHVAITPPPLPAPPPPATREVSGEIGGKPKVPPAGPPLERSGEIIAKPSPRSTANSEQSASSSGEIIARAKPPDDVPAPRRAAEIPVEAIAYLSLPTPPPLVPARVIPIVAMASVGTATSDEEDASSARGSIMGIGVGIGVPTQAAAVSGAVSGEIATKVKPGARVLVPGPNGLMQSATVRQLLQGYYELEVGSSGETIWVPINGVIPEP